MDLSELGIVVIEDVTELDKKSISNMISVCRNNNKPCFVFFKHEWDKKSEKILSHIKSYNDKNIRSVYGRCCVVKEIDILDLRRFCDMYHIQGSNTLGIVGWGIYEGEELLGVMSFGRHHRQFSEGNSIILDRLCFKFDVRVIGGASKLFAMAKVWAMENNISKVISYSDNRYSLGVVYEKLRFVLAENLAPDYFYISKLDQRYYSKQSQKKSNVNCPDELTEKQWAELRGLIQVYDAGKKKWEYHIQCVKNPIKQFVHRRQGYYKTKKAGVIYYSSSYELRAAYLLDSMSNVISYFTQVRFRLRDQERIIDFLVKRQDGSYFIIEVKPERQLIYCQQQIEDNRLIAQKNKWDFIVWTEKELGLSEYKIRKWADNLITEMTGIDVENERKLRSCTRSKKYYKEKISNNKVHIFCDYCQVTHDPLKLTYDKNIARNGRYICEREGGFIAGKKPKKKKENPYFNEGKKQCTNCLVVKLFNEFGLDKSRSDGYSNKCLECRANLARVKYNKKD